MICKDLEKAAHGIGDDQKKLKFAAQQNGIQFLVNLCEVNINTSTSQINQENGWMECGLLKVTSDGPFRCSDIETQRKRSPNNRHTRR